MDVTSKTKMCVAKNGDKMEIYFGWTLINCIKHTCFSIKWKENTVQQPTDTCFKATPVQLTPQVIVNFCDS